MQRTPRETPGEKLRQKESEARAAGSVKALEKLRAQGRMTAGERIDRLVDRGSFEETDRLARHRLEQSGEVRPGPYGDGVVVGTASIDGRTVCLFSQDFTVLGGSMGETHGRKILKTMDRALRLGCPVISINESGGARIQEGVVSLAYYAELGRKNAQASGVVPQIALIAGPCAGGAVYSPALMDFTVMVDPGSYMFVTGPDVVFSVTGEKVTHDELGGPTRNAAHSGNAHHVAASESDAIAWIQQLLSFLPPNSLSEAPVLPAVPRLETTARDAELDPMVPDAPNRVHDMQEILRRVVDDGEIFEVHDRFAPNIICAFARIDGHSVGVVANQPMHQAGVLDIDASEKAARFVRFCDSFNLPLLTFVDVPGYLPGLEQENKGIIRRGAKLLYAYAEAVVPKVTVVIRKAYGGAYAVMGSKHIGADLNLAWPTAQISVMGGDAAVGILHRRRLAALSPADADPMREHLVAEYERTLMTPYTAAERGYVDAVIEPRRTRVEIIKALRALRNKRQESHPRKHGNMPL